MMDRKQSGGFTLIELMLAMAFIAILLIAIATSTVHIIKLYDKGFTLRAVNQAGRDLGDNVKRDAIALNTLTSTFVLPEPEPSTIYPVDTTSHLGRMCLGTVSYLWNTADRLRAGTGATYRDSAGASGEQIVMARVKDVGGNYCKVDISGQYPSEVLAESATEMLRSADHDLAIHALSFERMLSSAGSQQLYQLSFTLGTNQDGTLESADTSCKPPADVGSNFNFCAVNTFELMVSVG